MNDMIEKLGNKHQKNEEEYHNHLQQYEQINDVPKSLNHDKRQKRRKQSAEDFTPPFLVNQMLDKLPEETWQEDKTFCDPACGNGNMLVEVIKRKLSKNHNPIKALSTVYGCDIMPDNIKECRLRLLKIIVNHYKQNKLPSPNRIELIKILWQNIICTPLRKYPNGSLDYNFNFTHVVSDHMAQRIYNMICKNKLIDKVSV